MIRKFFDFLFVFLLIVGIVLIFYFGVDKNNHNTEKLIINEVIPNNKNKYPNKDLEFFDIIELYNGCDYDINLGGYYISDDLTDLRKYKLPSIIIKSNDYLVIYASGENYYNDEIHTNFKLNNNGETIILSLWAILSTIIISSTYLP